MKARYSGIPRADLARLVALLRQADKAPKRSTRAAARVALRAFYARLLVDYTMNQIDRGLAQYGRDLRRSRAAGAAEAAEAAEATSGAAIVAVVDQDDQPDPQGETEGSDNESGDRAESEGEVSFWTTLAKERTKRIEARADSRARRAEAKGGRRGKRGRRNREDAAAEAAALRAAGLDAAADEVEAEAEADAEEPAGMPGWILPAAIAAGALLFMRK